MSNSDFDFELDEVEDVDTRALDPNIRKQLRQAKKLQAERDSAFAELESFKRDVTFTKLGISEDGIGRLFRKAYDGDVTPEAVLAAAEEYGIISRQQSNERDANSDTDAELRQLTRVQGATVGSSGSNPVAPEQRMAAGLADASTPEQVMAFMKEMRSEYPELGF